MEHLNDNLGHQASEFITRQKQLRDWLKEKLNNEETIGGWYSYKRTRKERLWKYRTRQYNGKRGTNPG